MRPGRVLLALGCALGAGCAAVPHDAGFGDVRTTIASRVDADLEWNRRRPEDAAVDERVRTLLREPLTVDAAIQIALLNNQQLQAIFEDLGVARAALVQAGLLKNPVFDAGVRLRLTGGPVNPEFAIAQDVLDAVFLPLRTRIAGAELEAAKQHVTGAVLELAGEVRVTYVELQADLQLLELEGSVMAAADAAADAAGRLHRAGNITALELANEQTLAAQARVDVALVEAHLDELRERLNALLGLWGPDTQWTITGRLSDPPLEEIDLVGVERRAVAASLDLAALQAQAVAARERVDLARAARFLPSFDLGAVADRDDGEWELGPSIALPLPLFDQGQAAVADTDAELRRVGRQYIALAVQLRAAVRAARNRLVAARQRAVFYRAVLLPLRHQVLEQTQLEYNAMLVGVFALLQAKQHEIDTGRRYVESLRDYWVSRAQLAQLLNGRLPQLAPGLGLPIPGAEEPVGSGESISGGHR